MAGASASEVKEKLQKVQEVCADQDSSDESKLIKIKQLIYEDGLVAQDFIALGKDYQAKGFYQEAVNAFWKARGLSSTGLDSMELVIATLELMTAHQISITKYDLDHLATTLAIDLNLSSEWSEDSQKQLKGLLNRFKALKEKLSFKD